MDLGKAPDQGTIALLVVTAAISSLLVGVFGKKLAESILAAILKPISYFYELAYRYIAPRNPFSLSIRSYRKHVLRSNLTRMENPVGPNLEVPLEHAFAPLKLRSSTTQELIDLFSYAATSRRCIVLGAPGTGKSTLMKSLVTSILKKRCHPDLDDSIPVFVVLRNLAKKQHTINQAIVSALADHHFPGADKFVESALAAGRMAIVLDGLDEVGASREFVAEQILTFCRYDNQRERPNRLFVTCREHSYRTMDLREGIPEIVQVEPFANHHMRVFLQGWPVHKGRSALRLYGLIQSDTQIRDICRNPLLLTILTGLYLDIDDFQIPSSRERFYQNAIDELLIHRPARRQVKQSFNADAKRHILERAALERLETVDQLEDPEELTHGAFLRTAEAILRQEKFDVNELIAELVEVNGIIKPASEDSFTCAHRTILEYFAAREAVRRRKTSEVIATFGGRPELIEVLYFYCGLLENLPALENIITSLIGQHRWLEAGRSLVHMKEAPDSNAVGVVASKLGELIESKVDTKAALEVLSSMANRRDQEFEAAGPFFTEAIDHLASSDESGASALESAIATSPDVALKLIPGMLKHNSERWKSAGVQLLRDIGTDEALDQLVQLLRDKDPYVRSRAGGALAGMIRSRNQELRQRAPLLAERKDNAIWPLESYFPGTIAIPIAEALVNEGESESRAINYAIKALKFQQKGSIDNSLRKWRRIPRDVSFKHYLRRCGLLVAACGLSWAALIVTALLILQLTGYLKNNIVLIRTTAPHFALIRAQFNEELSESARTVVREIERSHPPDAQGWARILPQNWDAEPKISESKLQAFRTVHSWASRQIDFRPSKLKDVSAELKGLASDRNLNRLQAATLTLRANSGKLSEGVLLSGQPLPPTDSLELFLIVFTLPSTLVMVTVTHRNIVSLRKQKMWNTYLLMLNSGAEVHWVFLLLIPMLFFSAQAPLLIYAWVISPTIEVLSMAATLLPSIGLVIARFRWPNNPLLTTIEEVSVGGHSTLLLDE